MPEDLLAQSIHNLPTDMATLTDYSKSFRIEHVRISKTTNQIKIAAWATCIQTTRSQTPQSLLVDEPPEFTNSALLSLREFALHGGSRSD